MGGTIVNKLWQLTVSKETQPKLSAMESIGEWILSWLNLEFGNYTTQNTKDTRYFRYYP